MFNAQFEEAKAALFDSLGPATRISVALDAWSAANHLSFLAVKVYFISQNWTLQEKLLDFIPMRGRHTGASIAADVLRILLETNTKARLLAITCDNASNNQTLTRTLQASLLEQDIEWDASENTVPCIAHIINLVVQDIIQHLQLDATVELGVREPLQRRHVADISSNMSIPNSLRKLRAICIAIDVSPQRYERFIATQQHLPAKERLSIIRDVKTRWNSTFDMCDRAVKIQKYIDEWLRIEVGSRTGAPQLSDNGTAEVDFRDLKRLRLSSIEWHHLELITEMLKRFKTATSFLSENQRPQIQYIWLMYNRLFDFLDKMSVDLDDDTENDDTTTWPAVVRAAAERGRAKLSKYYSRTEAERGFLFNCATILDPTQKLTAYEDDTWDTQDKHIYRQQFLSYLSRYDAKTGAESTISSTPFSRRSLGSEWFRKPAPPESPYTSFSTPSQGSFSLETDSASTPTQEEGDLYLNTACVIPNESFDILEWWRSNDSLYQNLSQVAKDVLAIPIAGVGVERVFNVAKDVIGHRRHRLSARTMRQIMLFKDSISQDVEQRDTLVVLGDNCSDAPADEVNDLLEVPAPVQDAPLIEYRIEREGLADEESPTQLWDLPPRKRQRPARYCDNTPL
ncbi:Dimer-Tnp-hAT domain-containing protein [Pyrenophora tritici-repentis]|nr:Dimer-Tnp-hAT domain-containing protein [Pyrenophora tritici-repentis]KAI0605559.1 Dimer-Tnp-hAT domain-containing protein [Pyrenophora tritici-repentis]KAI0617801.1 Dimer-Tnp-hAT domain-containing protein [Pyrenophora tritici-repentis]